MDWEREGGKPQHEEHEEREAWLLRFSLYVAGGHRPSGPSRLERHLAGYESSSTLMTSELESTSLGDSDEEDAMSRYGALISPQGFPPSSL